MQFLPNPKAVPLLEPPPAGHSAAAPHLLGQVRPTNARLQDKEDPAQGILIGHWRPPPLRLRRGWR